MAIRKPIPLQWKKKKHRLVVTMQIIERVNIEIGVMNLSKFDVQNFDFVKVSKFYYILFDECGFDAPWMDIYDVIFVADDEQKHKVLEEYGEHIQLFSPNFNAPMAKKKAQSAEEIEAIAPDGRYPLEWVYQIMVGHYNVAPSEFWDMTMAEAENIHEARRNKMVGNIHEDDYIAAVKRGEKLEAQGIKVL